MTGLIRVLTLDETREKYACCGWWTMDEGHCEATPLMRLATPHGEQDFCRDHIGYMVAMLPREWLDGFSYRPPVAIEETDDIPF